jgi:hypothetical protein
VTLIVEHFIQCIKLLVLFYHAVDTTCHMFDMLVFIAHTLYPIEYMTPASDPLSKVAPKIIIKTVALAERALAVMYKQEKVITDWYHHHVL